MRMEDDDDQNSVGIYEVNKTVNDKKKLFLSFKILYSWKSIRWI